MDIYLKNLLSMGKFLLVQPEPAVLSLLTDPRSCQGSAPEARGKLVCKKQQNKLELKFTQRRSGWNPNGTHVKDLASRNSLSSLFLKRIKLKEVLVQVLQEGKKPSKIHKFALVEAL